MPYFLYTAMNRDGLLVTGEGEFESLEDLYYSLQRDGLTLVKFSIKKGIFSKKFFSRIKRVEIAEFLHQLSFLIKSGVPLITALQDLEEETKNRELKRIISSLRRALLQGEILTDAMKKTKVFPSIVITLVQIGESSGNLDKTLEEASQHLYRVEEIISKTKRALIYPTLVILTMFGALAFWIFYVLPKILTVFKEMNIKLPISTIILMKIVDFFLSIKFYLPILIILLITILTVLYKHPKTQVFVDSILIKFPIFGRVKRLNFLAFFFEHFSLLLSSGVDILRLLKLMKESFFRKYYIKIVENIENNILRGETISQAMKKEKIFRPLDIRMVIVGEATGRLDEQMKILAKYYYSEVQNILDTLTKILEPVVLGIVGLIFLIIIIALIGPLYELISQLGKV